MFLERYIFVNSTLFILSSDDVSEEKDRVKERERENQREREREASKDTSKGGSEEGSRSRKGSDWTGTDGHRTPRGREVRF
jgi:hypothetical protein